MGAKVRIATVTLSDTRTEADDEGGQVLRALLDAQGFALASHLIVREDVDLIRDAVLTLSRRDDVDAIVTTGGTGLSPRDVTLAALEPLFDKPMLGFGEAFRRISWDDVGPRAMLSNASAGVVGGRVLFALPGSPKALRLAIPSLIAPILGHAVALARGRAGQHGPSSPGAGGA